MSASTTVRQAIFKIVKREAFRPGVLGVLINPFYIIRKGLYDTIRKTAPLIHGKVLDFGCGSKPYEKEFTNASEYIGIDLKQTGHDHHDSKVDVFYDGARMPLDDKSFDAVVAFEVFEHVFNIDEVLKDIRRVIKPGGKLFFTIPFVWDEHEVPYDFGRYTSFGIVTVLERNGYESIRVMKTTNYYQAVSQLKIAYIFQHVFPSNKIAKYILQMAIIAPMTVIALALNKVLPTSYSCFCNLAVICDRGGGE